MHPYPHVYTVQGRAESVGDVALQSPNLPPITSAPPAEFDGPGDKWSPETLLCAAIADCFLLSFRAVARASRIEWSSLDATVTGTLDRVDGKAFFTEFVVQATLHAPAGTDAQKATRALEKAEHVCLISNSLVSKRRLEPTVVVG